VESGPLITRAGQESAPLARTAKLERLLRPFADVRPGEAASALLLASTLFLLLTAYYLLKVVREPLILLSGGAEVKAYAAAGQALLLLPVLRLHGAVARRVGRLALIATVLLFVASNLGVFAGLFRTGVPIGLAFYLWVGTFNYLLVATFWSFATDVYSAEQGKRLFAIVGLGSSIGALAGAALASWLLKRLSPPDLMLVAAGILAFSLIPFALVDRGARRRSPVTGERGAESERLTGAGGFQALLQDRYLLMVALLTFLANWVVFSGEYVLDRTLVDFARSASHGVMDPARFVGQFKATYFWWVNLIGVVGQLFIVSRVLKHLGVGPALLALPLLSMLGASGILVLPVLGLIRVAQTADKSVEYSLQTTALNALYLVVSRDAKYKAKAVIDTFVVRFGEVCAAVAIWLGVHGGLPIRGFAALNFLLGAVWFWVALRVGALHRARSGEASVRPAVPSPERPARAALAGPGLPLTNLLVK
jgi:ATP:ADP antiporter, AAA family